MTDEPRPGWRPYQGMLSERAAARFLGVHRDTLAAWARRGLIRCYAAPSGGRRYSVDDLGSFLKPLDPGQIRPDSANCADGVWPPDPRS